MTEKLFTGTLNHNKNKKQNKIYFEKYSQTSLIENFLVIQQFLFLQFSSSNKNQSAFAAVYSNGGVPCRYDLRIYIN